MSVELPEGHVLNGRYKIISSIGKGSFGQTYLAKDTRNPNACQCIVKQFQPQYADPHKLEIAKRLFDREASILNNLPNHLQVPKFFDRFDEAGEFYLVQEFIPGTNLGREIAEGEQWDESRVVSLLYDVLKALEFLHQLGVIHRDIKPPNLIRRESNNKIVLIDFGSVKEVNHIDADGRPPTQIATPGYSPLEQSNGVLHPSNDLYALGMTAIEALTGIFPRQLRDFNHQVIWHPHRQTCSDRLKQILDRMVHPRFDRRYRSATEVLRDLRPLTVVPLTGHTLDRGYQLIKLLGGNEHRQTYKALKIRSSSSTPCIVHRIIPDSNLGFQAQQLFAIESTRLRRLGDYPQIASQLDEFESEGDFYIVREYIEGIPLDRELASGRRQTDRQVRSLLQDILQILRCFHQAGIVHGNIQSSAFIRRTSDSKLVLVDFGAAREPQLSPIGSRDGNRYLPPDRGNVRSDSSADIYAVGSIAIQALAGVHADELQDPYNPKTSWRSELPHLDPKLAAILSKMVHPDFRLRYQLVEDVLGDLNRSQSRIDKFQQFPQLRKLQQLWVQHPRFRLRLFGIGAGSLLLVLSAFVFFSTRPNSATRQCEALTEIDTLKEDQLDNAFTVCETATLDKPRSGILWNQLGDIYFQRKEWSNALNAYKRADRLDPKNPDFLADIGDTLSQLNRHSEAIVVYQQAIDLARKNPTFLFKQGEALARLGDDEEAIGVYDKIEALELESAEDWNRLGEARAELKSFDSENLEKALVAYQNAIELESNNLKVLVNQGRVLDRLNRYEEAEQAYQEATNTRSESPEERNLRGDAFFALNRVDEARKDYQRATEDDETNPKYWNDLGLALYELDRDDEALAAYEKAIELDESNPMAWNGKGTALIGLGEDKKALEAFDAAMALDRNDPKSRQNRGLALKELGRLLESRQAYEAALEIYDRQVSTHSQNLDAWIGRGDVLNQLQRYEEAKQAFDKALAINPTFFPALSKQANSLFLLGQFDEALEQIEEAISLAPSSQKHTILTTKGSFHTDRPREDGDKSSDYREALEAYNTALDAKPDFVPALQGLGMVFLQQEKYSAAISQFDRAIDLKDDAPQLWVLRGVALAQMQSWGLAQTSIEKGIEKGIELNSEDALAWYQLGQVQENLDKEAEAIASYARALEINSEFAPAREARSRLVGEQPE
ncbi:tetratricopeptide repeat protein [Oscillatoriales cyanobacterium LEGE 11467]|uniref:Tetratricopeptide repeat protein n=1 Tax=Zarconia navalis LEGE 11467 TaxID=1828826 RepID=A0A928VTG3_9CYAN|nr:tetratricopeptide repeat protein [Zarconia navalis]MBE9039957.1 tetratricopeptide repeat protein [Zarconia navalis LEGE 11467]